MFNAALDYLYKLLLLFEEEGFNFSFIDFALAFCQKYIENFTDQITLLQYSVMPQGSLKPNHKNLYQSTINVIYAFFFLWFVMTCLDGRSQENRYVYAPSNIWFFVQQS